MRHLLCLTDLGADGLKALLDRADEFKRLRNQPTASRPLAGKAVALVFEKASTRTRISLEVAVYELGGHPVVITKGAGSQIDRGEPVGDTARVLSRMVHAVTYRTSTHARLQEMVENSSVPVINALTDDSHPMQLCADLQTVRAVRGKLEGLHYAWIGDGNNMANSWIEAAGLLGLKLRLACPEGYDPNPTMLEAAQRRGADVQVVRDPEAATRGADVVSTDVFTSMGQEAEREARERAFRGFMVNRQLMQLANDDAIVLHCLPAHRGEEIEAEVIDGPKSVVWDEAEARLHTSKAALVWALEADG